MDLKIHSCCLPFKMKLCHHKKAKKKKKSRLTYINLIHRTMPLFVPCLIFILFCNSISADQNTVASASVEATIRDLARALRLVSGWSGSGLPEEGVLTALCQPQAQRFGNKWQGEMPRRGGSCGGDKKCWDEMNKGGKWEGSQAAEQPVQRPWYPEY